MITIEDSIEVNASPERVYRWLVERFKDRESYRAWHPDHVELRWIKGEPMQEGSIAYAEEYLHGRLHKLKFRITEVIPDRKITYRPLFPLSLIFPGNKFLIKPKGEDRCVFSAGGSVRMPRWLFEKFRRKHKDKFEDGLRHIREEGENLKKAVEEGSAESV